METKIEAEPEKETVNETKAESDSVKSIEENNSTTVNTKTKPITESTVQRLTPAILVSVSILLGSGILSATSYAKSKNSTTEIRNFYYQMPPPGPYMSNLEIPQHPAASNAPNHNRSTNFRVPQMNRPNWARPTPPWINRPPQMTRPNWVRPTPPWVQQQHNNLTEDQKSTMKSQHQATVPPPWVNQPPQMNRPNWARPTPPWVQQQHNNLTEDQKSTMKNQSQAMVQPNYYQNRNPGFNQPPPAWIQQQQQMNRPKWARPTPPWIQNAPQNTPAQETTKK